MNCEKGLPARNLAESPNVHNPAQMTLGTGFYAGPVALNWPPSHKLVTMENHLAVAQALERRKVDSVARDAYQRLVDFAEPEGERCLNNALQDQMEFAMNHPTYTEDGISAATRLMALPSNSGQLDMLSVDLADFYETAGDSERAEALYHEVLGRDPKEPLVYLRWARRLVEKGRTDEVQTAYQTVIDRKGRAINTHSEKPATNSPNCPWTGERQRDTVAVIAAVSLFGRTLIRRTRRPQSEEGQAATARPPQTRSERRVTSQGRKPPEPGPQSWKPPDPPPNTRVRRTSRTAFA